MDNTELRALMLSSIGHERAEDLRAQIDWLVAYGAAMTDAYQEAARAASKGFNRRHKPGGYAVAPKPKPRELG